jgi:hypothetical protein
LFENGYSVVALISDGIVAVAAVLEAVMARSSFISSHAHILMSGIFYFT